jgi:hypothetical protein
MSSERPRWKLWVRRVTIAEGNAFTFWGWRWEWNVRVWSDRYTEYQVPSLFGYSGQCRTKEKAMAHAEGAVEYFRQKEGNVSEPIVWYLDD